MRATVSIFAVLAIALTVQAKPQDTLYKHATANNGTEIAKGENLPVVPVITPQGNNCSDVEDVGVLPSDTCCYGLFGWDTTTATDDFDNGGICSAASYATGGGAQDQVVSFQVDGSGIWNFWTCGWAGWDTTLQVFEDGGAGCPTTQAAFEAQAVGCDGDGCGAPYFESDMYVALLTGETYYLVLDAWASWYYGSAVIVFYRADEFCSADAHCDDGNGCNGGETCDFQFGDEGLCQPGPGSPCESYQSCVQGENPNEYTCEDPDPCFAYFQHDQNSSYFGPARANGDDAIGNEMAYRVDAGRELVSYSHCVSGRGACDFEFTSSLWTVDPTDGDNGCLPLAKIPDTECAYQQSPDPGGTLCHYYTCTAGAGTILPENLQDPFNPIDERCGIDLYMVLEFSDERADGCDSHGAGLAEHLPTVGSAPFALFNNPGTGSSGLGLNAGRDQETFEWGLLFYSLPSVTDFANSDLCTVPVGACCYDDGGCDLVQSEGECMGTFAGISTLPDPHSCEDPDEDGFYNTCDNCPDVANPGQADCNGDGEGDACEADEAEQDRDGDGCCNGVDGCPDDPLKCAPGQCGCGIEDIDTDGDGFANCIDECPLDSNKQFPGCCGCGFADPDVDGDGFYECAPDADVQGDGSCVDTCPMVDDAQFGPCDPGVIPTVSEWGLVIMALLLLVAGKVYFGRRTALG